MLLGGEMDKHKLNNFFDYSLEPRRAILFEDVKSNYASIECVQRNLNPLTTSLCVMSRADNTKGLTLASSPTFKKIFGMKNISRASDLPFIIETRKFNFPQWYRTHTDIYGQRTEPTLQYVAFIESWAKRTWLVPPQMQLYVDYKIKVTEILTNYTSIEEIHSYSIDESFLDITESLNFFYPDIRNRYEQMNLIALDLQREILDKLGLYVTVGMGDNPLLAKLAMDNYAKHNQNMRALIRYEDVPSKLWTISNMTDFWGIGKRTEKRLNKLGISSIKELANADPLLLKQKLGTIGLQHFFHANGIDESNVREKYIPKSSSFSNSQILPGDYHKQKEIELVIKEMAENLAIRLRKGGKMASNLSLYVGAAASSEHSSIKISRNIEATQNTKELQDLAIRLFREKYQGGAVRQIGISGNQLSDNSVKQLSLFETVEENQANEKQESLQKAIDEIREKFDFLSIQKASSLSEGSRVIYRNKLIGGHAASQNKEDKAVS